MNTDNGTAAPELRAKILERANEVSSTMYRLRTAVSDVASMTRKIAKLQRGDAQAQTFGAGKEDAVAASGSRRTRF